MGLQAMGGPDTLHGSLADALAMLRVLQWVAPPGGFV
jgi:hypothetical protein